jgi:hypothetical protein
MKILGYVSLIVLVLSFVGSGIVIAEKNNFSSWLTVIASSVVFIFIVKAMIALGLF